MSKSYIGKVLDNYRILEQIGIGGMGIVFKALHIKLEKLFALKLIAPNLALNELFIKRFQTEAKALAKFEDPAIVRIYDLRSDEDNWFIVMEYVEGINLSDQIKKSGAVPWQEALPLFKQILRAFSHAHSAGIIHRDIKPNNVMLTTEGAVKITDFGLAKDQTSHTQTQTVTSGGTLYYMSPEHVKGFSFIDKRSDIYSIGMTFYEMLTGTVPFEDLSTDFDIRETIVRKDIKGPRTHNPDIPEDLEKIILIAISKDPVNRYQTAGEMLQAIEEFEYETLPPEARADYKRTAVKIEKTKTKQPKRMHWGRIGAIISIMVLIVMSYALYSTGYLARTSESAIAVKTGELSIGTQPGNVLVFLNNDSLGRTPVKNHVLSAGTHQFRFKHPGYITKDTSVTIAAGQSTILDIYLTQITQKPTPPVAEKQKKTAAKSTPVKPAETVLSISSSPSNAEIWINDEWRGNSPLRLSGIPAGRIKIEIRRTDHETFMETINIKRGQQRSVNARLSPYAGTLVIQKEPANAQIKLDGNLLPSDNLTESRFESIAIGRYEIEISAPGYKPYKGSVNITRNKATQIQTKLIQLTGELSVFVRPWGSIHLDGKLIRENADRRFRTELPAKTYALRIVHPTLGTWEKPVNIAADNENKIVVNFSRKIDLEISAYDKSGKPVNARIVIDNEDTGQVTPAKIKTRPGNHTVSVHMAGHKSDPVEKSIVVDADFTGPLLFILEKTN